MKRLITLLVSATLLAGSTAAFAQPGHDDHNTPPPRNGQMQMQMNGPGMAMHGPAHPEWKKGGHIAKTDWGRGAKIDYREHHLKKPPRGYEWRQVDDNYVLAAAATGLIASIILASH
jgi:Ni/Co efflux regulator RcnB